MSEQDQELGQSLRALLGPGQLSSMREPQRGEAARELPLALPADEAQLVECLRFAALHSLSVLPLGLGSKLGWCAPASRVDFALSTRRLARVVEHEPADGTLTAQAGCDLAALEARARAGGHRLVPGVPCPGSSTLGGAVAAGQSGFERLRLGPLRHHVLGLRVLDGTGQDTQSGGRLVKNVTGYDLFRMDTGAHGSLGLLLEISLRLFPLPEEEYVLALGLPSLATALELSAAWLQPPLKPLALVVQGGLGAHGGWRVSLVLSGDGAAVRAERALACAALARLLPGSAHAALEELAGARAQARLATLREAPCAQGVWCELELQVLPSRFPAVLDALRLALEEAQLDAECTLHPGLAQAFVALSQRARVPTGRPIPEASARCLQAALEPRLRALRAQLCWRRAPLSLLESIDPLGAPGPGVELMRRLRERLDPQQRFAPGRILGPAASRTGHP